MQDNIVWTDTTDAQGDFHSVGTFSDYAGRAYTIARHDDGDYELLFDGEVVDTANGGGELWAREHAKGLAEDDLEYQWEQQQSYYG